MAENLNLDTIARFTAFATAILPSAGRASNFTAQVATLCDVSGFTNVQVMKSSSTAAQVMAVSMPVFTCCQSVHAAPSNKLIRSSSLIGMIQEMVFIGADLFAILKIWMDAAKSLGATKAKFTMTGLPDGVHRIVTPVWRVLSEPEGFAAVSGRASMLLSILASLDVVFTLVITTSSALLVRSSHVVEQWAPIKRAIRTLDAAIGDEFSTFKGTIGSAMDSIVGDFGGSSEKNWEFASDEEAGRAANARGVNRLGSAFGLHRAVAAASARSTDRAFVVLNQSISPSDIYLQQMTLREPAAIAMVAAPLFAAPVIASMHCARRGTNESYGSSIVINSTPTIVINSNQSADIEHRVLGSLKQHREALFEQCQRELQRRQRTEF